MVGKVIFHKVLSPCVFFVEHLVALFCGSKVVLCAAEMIVLVMVVEAGAAFSHVGYPNPCGRRCAIVVFMIVIAMLVMLLMICCSEVGHGGYSYPCGRRCAIVVFMIVIAMLVMILMVCCSGGGHGG